MCWPRLEGGVEVYERRSKYPGEPRLKRLQFVNRHSRGDSDEWDLIRPISRLGSSRGSHRHEMMQSQWQQPPPYFPQNHHHPQPIHHQPPLQPLSFHGQGHQQRFLEPQHPHFRDVAPGVQAMDHFDGNYEDFNRPRGGGGDHDPRFIEREPRVRIPQHLQIPLGKAHHNRSHSRGRPPRREESVTTYAADSYTDYSGHRGGRRKSRRRARSLYSDTEDTLVDHEWPLRHYPRNRSRSRRRGYHH